VKSGTSNGFIESGKKIVSPAENQDASFRKETWGNIKAKLSIAGGEYWDAEFGVSKFIEAFLPFAGCPKRFEFVAVGSDQFCFSEKNHVLVVALLRSKSPVIATGDHQRLVHEHEFVVHL
jgi:hypothetical protein